MALSHVVSPLLPSFPGDLGLYIRHLTTGEEFGHQADAPFLTASVFKIPVLVELYRQVERGALRLDQSVTVRETDKVAGSGVLKELSDGHRVNLYELAMLMIIVSDNTATDLLMERLGKDAINATLRGLGLTETRVDLTCRELLSDLLTPAPPDAPESDVLVWGSLRLNLRCRAMTDLQTNDRSTAREMSRLLELIHRGEAASRASCDAMLEILGRQQVNDRVPVQLPLATPVAHKTGELPGIRNDAAIVYGPSGPYLFTAFTRNLADEVRGCRQVGEISRAVYDYFNQA